MGAQTLHGEKLKEELEAIILNYPELKYDVNKIAQGSETAIASHFQIFYEQYPHLKAYAYFLMIEEYRRKLDALEKDYRDRTAELTTKEKNGRARLERITEQLIEVEKEIEQKEAAKENIPAMLHHKLGQLCAEIQQAESSLERFGQRKTSAFREKEGRREDLIAMMQDCRLFIDTVMEKDREPQGGNIYIDANVTKYIYDFLVIEWGKREQEKVISQRAMSAIPRSHLLRNTFFVLGSAAVLLVSAYFGYLAYKIIAKPAKKTQSQIIAVETEESKGFAVDTVPELEDKTENSWTVVREIGIGEILYGNKIYRGVKEKGDILQLEFEPTHKRADGKERTQNEFSFPLKITAAGFDNIPDCRFLKTMLDFDMKTKRIRILQQTIAEAKPKGFRPIGIRYNPNIDLPITEFISRFGPADAYRVVQDRFGAGQNFIQFLWYEKGFSGRNERRIRESKLSSQINLTGKELDGQPDCVVMDTLGSGLVYIDVNTHGDIQFLEAIK
ncbi:hypothetical protein KY340_05265 [Candidatus Woesearchaeota archaeon]|nr:hypothetical protein [Candidatus Woesearchaeota archaeon]